MNKKVAALLPMIVLLSNAVSAADLKLLHRWSTPNAEKGYSAIQQEAAKKNLVIDTLQVSAEDSYNLTSIHNLAASSGNTPAIISLPIRDLQQLEDLKLVHVLNDAQSTSEWIDNVPQFVKQWMTYREKTIAAPLSIHVTNWVFANKNVIDQTGVGLSDSWDGFIALLEALEAKGITPIVHEGSADQDALMFESVFLATSGTQAYQQIFRHLSGSALRDAEPEILQTFQRLEQLKPFIYRLPEGSDPVEVADMMINNEAAITIQGDWIRGGFIAGGWNANQDYYCTAVPGEHKPVAFDIEAFAAVRAVGKAMSDTQEQYLGVQMSSQVQQTYNSFSGGIPALNGHGMDKTDPCIATAMARIATAEPNRLLVPSVMSGVVVRVAIRNAVVDVVNKFMTEDMTPKDAVTAFRKSIKRASLN